MTRLGNIAEHVGYTQRLIHAGMQGLHAPQGLNAIPVAQLSASVRASLRAAAVGAGLAWLGCSLIRRRSARPQAIVACSALAFCAEFGWRTRNTSTQAIHRASTEIARVRDQHWLEMNPIDYA